MLSNEGCQPLGKNCSLLKKDLRKFMNTRQNAHTARLEYHVNLTFTFQFFDQGVIRRDEEKQYCRSIGNNISTIP